MPRKPVSQKIAEEVYDLLVGFGEKGGTWEDVFAKTDYAESVCRDALFALEKADRARRTPRWRGTGRGGKPSLWHAVKKEEP